MRLRKEILALPDRAERPSLDADWVASSDFVAELIPFIPGRESGTYERRWSDDATESFSLAMFGERGTLACEMGNNVRWISNSCKREMSGSSGAFGLWSGLETPTDESTCRVDCWLAGVGRGSVNVFSICSTKKIKITNEEDSIFFFWSYVEHSFVIIGGTGRRRDRGHLTAIIVRLWFLCRFRLSTLFRFLLARSFDQRLFSSFLILHVGLNGSSLDQKKTFNLFEWSERECDHDVPSLIGVNRPNEKQTTLVFEMIEFLGQCSC